MIKVKFWGTRGSIPSPGKNSIEYGGNTACIELRFDGKDFPVIIDAGSGIRELGTYLMKNDLSKGSIKAHLFFTHSHWDHIMGFPFFVPIYIPTTELDIYGAVTYDNTTLKDILSNQLTYRYFPVNHSELSANIKYHEIKESKFTIEEEIVVETKHLNHPIICLAYKFTYKGKKVATCYDHEKYQNIFDTSEDDPSYDELSKIEGAKIAEEENNKIIEFLKDCDLVIFDSQYTKAEYFNGKVGWGHSCYEDVIEIVEKANIKKGYFFHHDPDRKDSELDELAKKYCNYKTTFIAKDNLVVEI